MDIPVCTHFENGFPGSWAKGNPHASLPPDIWCLPALCGERRRTLSAEIERGFAPGSGFQDVLGGGLRKVRVSVGLFGVHPLPSPGRSAFPFQEGFHFGSPMEGHSPVRG